MKQALPLCWGMFQSRREVRWTRNYSYSAPDRCYLQKKVKRGYHGRTTGVREERFRYVFLEEVVLEESLKK